MRSSILVSALAATASAQYFSGRAMPVTVGMGSPYVSRAMPQQQFMQAPQQQVQYVQAAPQQQVQYVQAPPQQQVQYVQRPAPEPVEAPARVRRTVQPQQQSGFGSSPLLMYALLDKGNGGLFGNDCVVTETELCTDSGNNDFLLYSMLGSGGMGGGLFGGSGGGGMGGSSLLMYSLLSDSGSGGIFGNLFGGSSTSSDNGIEDILLLSMLGGGGGGLFGGGMGGGMGGFF